jgi:hypothetical protein
LTGNRIICSTYFNFYLFNIYESLQGVLFYFLKMCRTYIIHIKEFEELEEMRDILNSREILKSKYDILSPLKM